MISTTRPPLPAHTSYRANYDVRQGLRDLGMNPASDWGINYANGTTTVDRPSDKWRAVDIVATAGEEDGVAFLVWLVSTNPERTHRRQLGEPYRAYNGILAAAHARRLLDGSY